MEAIKRRLAAILERLKSNEAEDRGQGRRIDALERRVARLEGKAILRPNELDADE